MSTHSSPSRAVALALTLAAAALLAAGCGEDEDSDSTSTAAAEETSTTAATGEIDAALLDEAVIEYDAYVERETGDFVVATEEFLAPVEAGDIEAAKAAYPGARVHFERIEPVAGAFGDLDPDIDGREGDIPPMDWGGYHRIEKALWVAESTEGLEETISELRNDVTNLDDIAIKAEFDPEEIAQGSVDLLAEVSASKITGEEERYSHTDLWDFEANVAGAEAGFEALEAGARADRSGSGGGDRGGVRGDVRGPRPAPRGRRVRPLRHAERGADAGARTADRHARRTALAGTFAGRLTDEKRLDISASRRGLTRRGLLTTAGAAGAGLGLGVAGYALGQERASDDEAEGTGTVPFWGERQAGIVTTQQDRLFFAAFDRHRRGPSRARDAPS